MWSVSCRNMTNILAQLNSISKNFIKDTITKSNKKILEELNNEKQLNEQKELNSLAKNYVNASITRSNKNLAELELKEKEIKEIKKLENEQNTQEIAIPQEEPHEESMNEAFIDENSKDKRDYEIYNENSLKLEEIINQEEKEEENIEKADENNPPKSRILPKCSNNTLYELEKNIDEILKSKFSKHQTEEFEKSFEAGVNIEEQENPDINLVFAKIDDIFEEKINSDNKRNSEDFAKSDNSVNKDQNLLLIPRGKSNANLSLNHSETENNKRKNNYLSLS